MARRGMSLTKVTSFCVERGVSGLTGVCALEELSEEDQQLKSELEMLVDRLKVRGAFLRGPKAMGLHRDCLGTGHKPLQTRLRSHQKFHQDFDILDDCRSKTSQIPTTTL